MDFLAENNYCGQTLLKLVSRGNSAVAELFRLKDVIPSVYSHPTNQEKQKFGDLISPDISYFSGQNDDSFEKRIESNDALKALDEELKSTHVGILTRFYQLFENIHRYAVDLIQFLQELDDGKFIQSSMESVFHDPDGKQLMCESLFLFGVMLLAMDFHIEGPVREKMLVAYFRYSGDQKATESKYEEIVQLWRSTDYNKSATKRVAKYPDSLFKRFLIPEHFIRMVIGRLRSDDVYNQARCYPNPEHRCTAHAEQASMLFICLFFAPTILDAESATMREIVDKFFPDNWVVSVSMGTVYNIVDWWDPYRAAKAALANTIQASNVKGVAVKYVGKLLKLLPDTQSLLQEGALTEENVLDNSVKVLNIARECNVTLRWLMLHTANLTPGTAENHKKCKQLRDIVMNETKARHGHIFQLLLNTSQFEFKLSSMYKNMLRRRKQTWEGCREKAREKMMELVKLIENDAKQTAKAKKLKDWLIAREAQMAQLSLDDPIHSGNLARQLLDALHEALEFDQFEANWAIKQIVEEAKDFLRQMIRTAGIRDDDLVILQLVGDFSYAWEIIDTFTLDMQEGVKRDPALVGKLRATFLKVASAVERPVLRISQAKSRDLVSVSQYYSSELVAYVRKVLQIIPVTMFKLLDQIIKLQTQTIKDIPTRLDKDKLKDFAQLNERIEVARLTHSISVFTEGILAMKSTLYGVIKVDPKQLLEDGIRKELVRLITMTLHFGLSPTSSNNQKRGVETFAQKMEALKKTMNGLRTSFLYIQDYVNIAGLKIWQEELSRIINFYVEMESNLYLKQKVLDFDSIYQSKSVTIPFLRCGDVTYLTFMGRLAQDLMLLTSPKTTVFVPARQTWYDIKTLGEVASLTQMFPLIESAMGSFGMVGLDRLLGLQAATLVQKIVCTIEESVMRDKLWTELLANLSNSLNPIENVIAQPAKFYHQQHLSRANRALTTLTDLIVDLGQLQLLRQCIAYQRSTSANFDSKLVFSSIKTFNSLVVHHLEVSKEDSGTSESSLLYELGFYLSSCGLSEPLHQVYMIAKASRNVTELLFLCVVGHLNRSSYSPVVGDLMSSRKDHVDSQPFNLGLITLLKQYPTPVSRGLIEYLAQYARSFMADHASVGKAGEVSQPVANALMLLERLKAESGSEFDEVISENQPDAMRDLFSKTS